MRIHQPSGPRIEAADIDRFISDGFLKVEAAVPDHIAAQCRDLLWRVTGCDPDDPATWTRPVVRAPFLTGPPFRAAANTPILHAAFDALVGPGRWEAPGGLGTFPIRFPSPEDPGDCGWHIDASFGQESPDFMQWQVNVASRGRALLMLFLLSDTGPDDAPTRILRGSHLDVARTLAPYGDEGATLGELASIDFGLQAGREEALAVGAAGDVYLCHPFLVHAAQPHRGARPRFLAQPPLLPTAAFAHDDRCPVRQAITRALNGL